MSGLDTLTTFQLETAAADLRNAGLVVKHAGHFKRAMVDHRTGRVCASGAIDLATFRRLSYLDHIKAWAIVDEKPRSDHRAELAYRVFADFLPSALCDKCDYDVQPASDWSPWERVVHYNDAHCVSGELLVNMFNCAADKAKIAAAERRTMLTGRVLEAV